MLRKIEIHNFKSIRKQSLDLGQVNIFVGGNGVGKTNFLEAIGILSAGLSRDLSTRELQSKGVRLSVPALFKSAFKNRKLPLLLKLKAEFDNGVSYQVALTASDLGTSLKYHSEKITHNQETLMGRSPSGVRVPGLDVVKSDVDRSRGIWDRFRELQKYSDEVAMELENLRDFAIFEPQTAFLRGTALEQSPVEPLGLQGGNLARALLPILRDLRSERGDDWKEHAQKVLNLVWEPGWANNVRVQSSTPELVSGEVVTRDESLFFRDKWMHRQRHILSAYDSSEGNLYLLFLAVLLLHTDTPNIFGLDNVDHALNPAISRKAIETLIQHFKWSNDVGRPKQAFLTTHNPTTLDGFDIFDPEQRVFIVSRNADNGETVINRLAPSSNLSKSDWVKMAQGRSLSEMWIGGQIKGALG